MVARRAIPCLLLEGETLVKTRRFRESRYVGDPLNTARTFNELEVDELVLLDITASSEGRSPNLELLRQLTAECFMPLAYGGGVTSLEQMARLYTLGVEKVILNSAVFGNPRLVREAAREFGSQAVVGSVDARRRWLGGWQVYSHHGQRGQKMSPREWARRLQDYGVGELLLTSIDQEGTWGGYDLPLLREVVEAVTVPVIVQGGAGSLAHVAAAIQQGASGVGLGSLVLFQGPGLGVLVSFPDQGALTEALRPPG